MGCEFYQLGAPCFDESGVLSSRRTLFRWVEKLVNSENPISLSWEVCPLGEPCFVELRSLSSWRTLFRWVEKFVLLENPVSLSWEVCPLGEPCFVELRSLSSWRTLFRWVEKFVLLENPVSIGVLNQETLGEGLTSELSGFAWLDPANRDRIRRAPYDSLSTYQPYHLICLITESDTIVIIKLLYITQPHCVGMGHFHVLISWMLPWGMYHGGYNHTVFEWDTFMCWFHGCYHGGYIYQWLRRPSVV